MAAFAAFPTSSPTLIAFRVGPADLVAASEAGAIDDAGRSPFPQHPSMDRVREANGSER